MSKDDGEQEAARIEAMFDAVDAYVCQNPYIQCPGVAPIFDLIAAYVERRREPIAAWMARYGLAHE